MPHPWGRLSSVFLRCALGLGVLSAEARFSLWGAFGPQNVEWGNFARFRNARGLLVASLVACCATAYRGYAVAQTTIEPEARIASIGSSMSLTPSRTTSSPLANASVESSRDVPPGHWRHVMATVLASPWGSRWGSVDRRRRHAAQQVLREHRAAWEESAPKSPQTD
jgi:hypothetical protein